MYYGVVQALPQAVLAYIRKHGLLRPGDRVGVAVSGGADSVGLMRLLLDLRSQIGIVLAVVHFNHRLRGSESDQDERFVAELAKRCQLEFHAAEANVAARASERGLSLEAAGRELRYQYFYRLLAGKLNRIATAHTLDDQAETVLLKLARGAGSRGLAGIYPELPVPGRARSAAIVRPLLPIEGHALREYLSAIGQIWREDPSNQDLRHARNRVRRAILPCLARDLNPAVRERLAETAEIARGEEQYWEQKTQSLLASAWVAPGPHPGNPAGTGARGSLRCDLLRSLPLALGRRLVRRAAESLGLDLEFRHVEEILGLAQKHGESEKTLGLPGGWTARLSAAELQFAEPHLSPTGLDYEYRLAVPGSIEVPQTGSRFEAVLVSPRAGEGYNPDGLLDRARLSGELRVRNWRPGDRFWPAHRKAPKKIKELLEERHLRGTERKGWPVVVNGGELVWVRGFAVPRRLWPRDGSQALWIREVRLEAA
ncbi:MAG TPA: tRNA lysidine(34) synthetase TilS [Terriglobales bacterium]|nr:tRNA lysidine(34) synthetase TilS [Terriglobales bacterium]